MTDRVSRIKAYQKPKSGFPRKKNLSSSFPLNLCNSIQLKDTWKSIRIGLKHSISDYNDNPMDQLDSCKIPLNLQDEDYWSSDEESIESIFDNDQSSTITTDLHIPIFELKSNLKHQKRPENYEINEMPLAVSRQIIQKIMQTNFEHAITDISTDFVNYIFNMIVQDYTGADMKTICNYIISKDNERKLFYRIKELLMDKYVETKLDAFYDRCLSLFLNFEDIEIENLSLYSQYKDIWIFDSDEYQVYDYATYKQEMLNEYSFSSSIDDYYVNYYANNAFLMNLEKFYYYYSKDLNIPLAQSRDEENMDINEIMQEKLTIKPSENSSMTTSEQLRTTSLRFSSISQVYEIDQEEPPFNITKFN